MKSDIHKFVELIGILGVIASLVFVGMQLRLDRRVALAEQYFNRAESFKDDIRSRVESDSISSLESKLWELGERPDWWNQNLESEYEPKKLSGAEIMARVGLAEVNLIHMDNIYFQYQSGLIDETFWQGVLSNAALQIEDPLYRAVYANYRRPVSLILDSYLGN